MPSTPRNVLLLTLMVIVDGAVLFFVPEAWERTTLGLLLLVPIVLVSTYIELPDALTRSMRPAARPRHFPALRANVEAFMTEVKRLNWLIVDMDRGFGRPEDTAPEIESCHRRMQELLGQIQETAGRPDWESQVAEFNAQSEAVEQSEASEPREASGRSEAAEEGGASEQSEALGQSEASAQVGEAHPEKDESGP